MSSNTRLPEPASVSTTDPVPIPYKSDSELLQVKPEISSDNCLNREKVTVSLRKEKQPENLQKNQQEPVEELSIAARLAKLQRLPEFIDKVNSDDIHAQIEGTKGLRQILSMEDPDPISATIRAGVLPRLVDFLCSTTTELQFEAAWALTNIASGTSEHTNAVVQAYAIPALVKCIGTPGELRVKEQCIWALGNIAGEGATHRNYILNVGAMGVIVQSIEQAIDERNSKILKNVVWALANLCRAKPLPDSHLIAPAMPLLVRLLSHNDSNVVSDAMWAFVYLSDSDEPQDIQRVIDSGVLPKLIEMLSIDNAAIQTPALRALGNVLTGNDRQSDDVLSLELLPALKNIIVNGRPALQKEAIWALSNVTAGSHQQINLCFANGLITAVLELMNNSSFDVRKEAVWCIANAIVSGSIDHAKQILDLGGLLPIIQLLNAPDADAVSVALDAVTGLLKHGDRFSKETGEINPFVEMIRQVGGIEKVVDLQRHPSDKIYHKCANILDKYCNDLLAENDTEVAPEVSGTTYQFAPDTQFSLQ
ncbi:hypothetical protein GEMRC1_013864 [Eukaryota sp. GEM-RC1]